MAERLTHSKRSTFLFCQRQFKHRYEDGLELIAQKAGRRRGTIFGNAIAAAREESDNVESLLAARRSIDESYAQAWEHVSTQEDVDSAEIERVKVRVMAGAYLLRYGQAARREVEYELPYRNPATGGYSKTWRIAGKIDGLEVVGPQRGRLIEDKFVGTLQKAMIDKLSLDLQTTEYVDALRVKGWTAEVAYRHTRYPGINPEKAKEYKTKADRPAESMDEFEARLTDDVLARPEFYFDEQILMFPTGHLDEYEQERWTVGQMIIEARAREREVGIAAWVKNPTRCAEWGGCAFLPLCTQRPDAGTLYTHIDPEVELSEREATDG